LGIERWALDWTLAIAHLEGEHERHTISRQLKHGVEHLRLLDG
jgi:hypothetical protein